MSRPPAQVLLGIVCCAAIVGCGSAKQSSDIAHVRQFEPPTTPTAQQCDARALATSTPADHLAPSAGTYRYRLQGTKTTIGSRRTVHQLPTTMPAIVTPVIRAGRLLCFRLQRRLSPNLVQTATLVVRGGALYASEVRLETANGTTSLRPQPALLAVSAGDLDWSGAFTGQARGQYVGHLLGRRTVMVGTNAVRAIGVAATSSFAGDVTGTQRSQQWFSIARHLLVREKTVQQWQFGVDNLRIDYSAQLLSLQPGGPR
jgi:hypothetical protein